MLLIVYRDQWWLSQVKNYRYSYTLVLMVTLILSPTCRFANQLKLYSCMDIIAKRPTWHGMAWQAPWVTPSCIAQCLCLCLHVLLVGELFCVLWIGSCFGSLSDHGSFVVSAACSYDKFISATTVVDLIDIRVFLVGSFLILPFFDMTHLLLDIHLLLIFWPTPFWHTPPPVGYSSFVHFLTHPFFNVVVAYRLGVGTCLNLKPILEYMHVHHTMLALCIWYDKLLGNNFIFTVYRRSGLEFSF